MSKPASPSPSAPLSEHEIDALQTLLDNVPEPLAPLDLGMVDGFLCGVLVQPRVIPPSRWLPLLTDAEGRALPASFDASRLHALVLRRHAELDAAIARRDWFDPWVFEPDHDDDAEDSVSEIEIVYPWVAGFAAAMEAFPQLIEQEQPEVTEPMALLFRHLDPDDLEDADALIEEIESLEPPADRTEAVEELVRATLQLADVSRPLARPPAARPRPAPSRRRPPPRR